MEEEKRQESLRRRKHAQRIVLVLALLGLLVVTTAFYPGMMSPESIEQYVDVLNGKFVYGRAPLMSLVWSILGPESPFSILLFHGLLFSGAIAILAVLAIRSGSVVTGLLLASLGLMPQHLAMLGVVWKDVALGSSLLCGLAFVELFREKRKPVFLGVAAILFFYGASIGVVGGLAMIPLMFYACHVYSEGATFWKKLAATALLGSVFFFTAEFTAGALSREPANSDQEILEIYDMAGIAVNKGAVHWPASMGGKKDFPTLVNLAYSSDSAANLIGYTGIALPLSAPAAEELRAAWMQGVRSNPWAYLRHRWDVFAHLLGLSSLPAFHPYRLNMADNPLGLKAENTLWSQIVYAYIVAFSESSFFRTALWLTLAIAGCIVQCRRRGNQAYLSTALVASGFLSVAPLFYTAAGIDFRFAWWCLLAAQVAFLMSEKALSSDSKPSL